jgi:hypothetical protein
MDTYHPCTFQMAYPRRECATIFYGITRVLLVLHVLALISTRECDGDVPTNVITSCARASEFVRNSDVERAIAHFENAIRNNPEDTGRTYACWPQVELSDEDLEYGRQQLDRLFVDRPEMGKHGAAGSPLAQWAVRKFAGEDLGRLIEWDSTLPLVGDAEHDTVTDRQVGRVRISGVYRNGDQKDQKRDFEELWMNLTYELINIGNSPSFRELDSAAQKGQISKDYYVRGMFGIELKAVQATRAFYVRVFLPWASANEVRSDPRLWYTHEAHWGTISDALQWYSDPNSYPWQPYERYYDELKQDVRDVSKATEFDGKILAVYQDHLGCQYLQHAIVQEKYGRTFLVGKLVVISGHSGHENQRILLIDWATVKRIEILEAVPNGNKPEDRRNLRPDLSPEDVPK